METKNNVGVNPLVQARTEALENQEFSLRPLGKLWGMDVFTWYNASCENIASTIAAFPFPVIWFSAAETITQMLKHDAELMKSIQWLGQYNTASMQIPQQVARVIPLVTSTENLSDSLTLLRHNKQEKFALLFTTSGEGWKTYKQQFEDFVSINK